MTEVNTALKSQKSSFDLLLLAATAALVVSGLIAIYDASVVTAFRDFSDKFYFFKNQLLWAALGSISLGFFSLYDYQRLLKFATPLYLISVILLILVLVPHVGTEVLGARRWINIGSFTFQPSEFVKLSIILYTTALLTKIQEYKLKISDAALIYFLPVAVVTGLIVIQPDLGTGLILLALAIFIYFAAGSPIWHFLVTLPVLASGGILAIIFEPYRLERIKAFLDPNYDPQGASYQINQIIIALSSGGLLGVGLGGSRSKFEFIPEVHNDAIFAVIIEELGFVGGLILISLFVFLIIRAIKIAREATNYSGKLLATGLVGLISIQALFNLASVVALVPLTGIPLPFISYGGSSLLVTMVAVGILENIKRQS